MTPEQWLSKYYPVPASALAEASDEECLLHCEKKWEGAMEENLPEGMTYSEHCVGIDGFGLIFDCDTCALCHKYGYEAGSCENNDGIKCPIVRMQGFTCCHTPFNHMGTFEQSENDPSPMIDLLKRTLEFVRNGG